jgi:hypothetical protein
MFSFLFHCCWAHSSSQKSKLPAINNMATLYLPETLKNWPWPRAVNPHYEEIAAKSLTWLHSYNFFPPKAQQAFDQCNYGEFFCQVGSDEKGSRKDRGTNL